MLWPAVFLVESAPESGGLLAIFRKMVFEGYRPIIFIFPRIVWPDNVGDCKELTISQGSQELCLIPKSFHFTR